MVLLFVENVWMVDCLFMTCNDRVLKNNHLDGTLDIGTAYSNHLRLIDLRTNSITEYEKRIGEYSNKLMYALL